jgi:hypothetical protein
MCALARRDEALRNDERGPAPPFGDLTTVRGRLVSTLCRVLDLQVASIWRDLKSPLGEASGTVFDVGAGASPTGHSLIVARPIVPSISQMLVSDSGMHA